MLMYSLNMKRSTHTILTKTMALYQEINDKGIGIADQFFHTLENSTETLQS